MPMIYIPEKVSKKLRETARRDRRTIGATVELMLELIESNDKGLIHFNNNINIAPGEKR